MTANDGGADCGYHRGAMMTAPNPYLRTPRGLVVGSRAPAAMVTFGALFLGPALGAAIGLTGALLDDPDLGPFAVIVGFVVFVLAIVPLLVVIRVHLGNMRRASGALWAGDTRSCTHACHGVLQWVFRADLRTKAFHLLGLIAEADGQFAAAADLFDRAHRSIPALSAPSWKHRAEAIILAHLAIALVAIGAVDRADGVVQRASRAFALGAGPTDPLSALIDEPMVGGHSFVEVEGPRDPRALVTLASALVLAARGRGREAIDLLDRERASLRRGLPPRERGLAAAIERDARALLEPGIMRQPGQLDAEPWAAQVLAHRR